MNKRTVSVIIASIIAFVVIIILMLSLFNKNDKSYLIQNGIVGKWGGLLKTPINQYYLLADINLDSNKKLKIKLSSPRQRKFSIPVDSLVVDNNIISFKIKKVAASFKGKFIPDSSKISGTWFQEKHSSPLVLYHQDEMGRINRPQYPFKPYPYVADSVNFPNVDDSISLSGTITYPKIKNKKFPAVLLLSGVGPQDRDGTSYGHKPFLIMADYLTRHGYAVLRVDDRGTGESEGDYFSSTTSNFTKDAVSAINYLKNFKNIDTTQIGVIGFNEGGLISANLASQLNYVSFLVLLSTPGLSAEQVLLTQTKILQQKANVPKREQQLDYDINKKIFKIIMSNADSNNVKKELNTLYKKFVKKLTKNELSKRKYSSTVFKKKIEFMLTPWFRYFLNINVKKIFENVKCPVLVLFGEKDLQVEPKENMKAIVDVLRKSGNVHVKQEIVPGLNHFFQNCKTGLPNEYFKIKETFSVKVLDTINKWIKNNIKENQ